MKRLILLGFLASITASAAFASEEILLAAAIGAPPLDKPVVEEVVRPTYSEATTAAGSGMATTATIVIGVAVAAVIAGSSSDSTPSH